MCYSFGLIQGKAEVKDKVKQLKCVVVTLFFFLTAFYVPLIPTNTTPNTSFPSDSPLLGLHFAPFIWARAMGVVVVDFELSVGIG